jgi:hypothetical protein
MTDLEELKRLAEAAGGGEWFYRPGDLDDWGDVRDANAFRICQARDPRKLGRAVEAFAREMRTDPWEAPARHIAAANPATILSLIERVERAEAHVARLQHAVGGASIAAYQRGMEDIATWYSEHGWLLDEEDVADAIREKAKAISPSDIASPASPRP